ncbi:tail assembly protein [Pseudomonas sp. RIT-PI-AD]|uniref:tail assembly protein n=1 Tax=Pseudomonas sp. RIT-PI-AD TaxID=3035294 RepID=UPI0021D87FFE|nr:tail assembly protein [Pseudomonas sp. RIT-PI-AD]
MTSPIEYNRLRTIRLYGVLGARFGRLFRLAVSSPAEAIQALRSQLPGFTEFLASSEQRGLRYAVFYGKRNLAEQELSHRGEREDIRIAPILLGSKRAGTVQTIIGAVLILVAWINPAGFLTGPMVSAMMFAGASQMVGGVMQMMSPQPKGLETREAQANTPSYSFGGPVNTIAQGHPVALLYGRRLVGGAIISAGIYAEDKM